jgi:hypothetical protein
MRNAVHTLTVPRFGGITRDLCDDDLEDRGATEIDTNFAVDWNNYCGTSSQPNGNAPCPNAEVRP